MNCSSGSTKPLEDPLVSPRARRAAGNSGSVCSSVEHMSQAQDRECHLDDYLLQNILSNLSGADVCRAQAVNKRWHKAAEDVQEEIFRRFWGLRDVLNRPRRSATYLTAELAQFVRQHKCRRWDTLASVAVQYGSDVAALRRLNNLMSDDALRSRMRVYVPVLDKGEVHDQAATFLYDPMIGRELIILDSAACVLAARGRAAAPRPPSALDAAKLCSMLGRSLHIDEQTAKFYLEDAHGDLKKAYQLHQQDMEWERMGLATRRGAR